MLVSQWRCRWTKITNSHVALPEFPLDKLHAVYVTTFCTVMVAEDSLWILSSVIKMNLTSFLSFSHHGFSAGKKTWFQETYWGEEEGKLLAACSTIWLQLFGQPDLTQPDPPAFVPPVTRDTLEWQLCPVDPRGCSPHYELWYPPCAWTLFFVLYSALCFH